MINQEETDLPAVYVFNPLKDPINANPPKNAAMMGTTIPPFSSCRVHPNTSADTGNTPNNVARPLFSLSCGSRRPSRRAIYFFTARSDSLPPTTLPRKKPQPGAR